MSPGGAGGRGGGGGGVRPGDGGSQGGGGGLLENHAIPSLQQLLYKGSRARTKDIVPPSTKHARKKIQHRWRYGPCTTVSQNSRGGGEGEGRIEGPGTAAPRGMGIHVCISK